MIMGILGAGAIIAHEMRSYLALKNVEINQQRLTEPTQNVRHSDVREAIRSVIAEIPVNLNRAGLAAFSDAATTHSPAQQIRLFGRSLKPLTAMRKLSCGGRARASDYAISPTAHRRIFLIACSIDGRRPLPLRHRPTALAPASVAPAHREAATRRVDLRATRLSP